MAEDDMTTKVEEQTEKKAAPNGNKKGRPLWLRTLRGLGWTLFLAVYAVVIIISSVVWILSPERLTPIAERMASKTLNAEVTLDRVELTFWSSFPKVKVEVDGMNIVSRSLSEISPELRATLPADADSVVAVGHFTGGINLVALAGGKIALNDVKLDSPHINLIQVNDTISNFNIFPKSAPDTTTTSSAMPEISIDHFAITNALPIRYRSLPDSIDVAMTLRTVDLQGDAAPQYKLELSTDIATPLLADFNYDELTFSLDGKINWDAQRPQQVSVEDLKFKLDDDIDLTMSTQVDMSENLRFEQMEVALSNLRPANIVEHIPAAYREKLQSLDTDMAINLNVKLLQPYVLADSVTLPQVEGLINIPDSYFKFQTIDFHNFTTDIKATIDGGNLNRSVINIERLAIDGHAMDINITGTVTSLLSDPYVKGHFFGALDFDKLPAIAKQNMGGKLSGKFDADTKFNFHLSDISPRAFHKANLSGEVNLRDLRYLTTDTLTQLYTRQAQLTFGTGESLDREENRVDSLLIVKIDIDTAYLWSDGMEARLKAFRAGFGASNVASSSDTTQINPFGGAINIADFYCFSPTDSMRMRLRDVTGVASLKRFQGDTRLPQLDLQLKAGRLRMSQPKYAASLRGMKFDINANLRPRRNGKMRSKPRATAGDALRALSENDTMQQKSLQARMLRLAAQQMDSAKVEVLDFNVDNSFRSLLRRWNIHGAIAANSGNLRFHGVRVRNRIDSLDLTFNTDSVSLHNLNCKFGHSDFKVKGSITNIKQALSMRRPGPVRIDFNMQSDTLNVNEIVRGLCGSSAGIEESTQAWTDETEFIEEGSDTLPDSIVGPLLIPVNIDAALNIQARKVVYSDLILDSFDGKLMINSGMVKLDNLSADTDVGSLKFSGLYSAPKAENINFGMAMDLKDFNISRLPHMIPAIDTLVPMMQYLSGIVNAHIAVTSDITPDMYFKIPTMKAAMQFTGDSLVLFDNDTFRTLSKWLMFKNKQRNMIDSIDIELTISDGHLNLYPFIMNIDRYKLGVMGYNDLDFNLNYHISVLKSPIPFKFGINIKGAPGDMKIRLGGAKFKENMVAQRDSIAVKTRISLLSEINGAFRRGLRAARLGPLRIRGRVDSTYMQAPEDRFSASDSAVMIREGMIEVPDSVAAEIYSRTNGQQQNGSTTK